MSVPSTAAKLGSVLRPILSVVNGISVIIELATRPSILGSRKVVCGSRDSSSDIASSRFACEKQNEKYSD